MKKIMDIKPDGEPLGDELAGFWVIAEAGAGLYCGECMGFGFCWNGSDSESDVPRGEVILHEDEAGALEMKRAVIEEAKSWGSRSLPIFENWVAVRIEPGEKIEDIAGLWEAVPEPSQEH